MLLPRQNLLDGVDPYVYVAGTVIVERTSFNNESMFRVTVSKSAVLEYSIRSSMILWHEGPPIAWTLELKRSDLLVHPE